MQQEVEGKYYQPTFQLLMMTAPSTPSNDETTTTKYTIQLLGNNQVSSDINAASVR